MKGVLSEGAPLAKVTPLRMRYLAQTKHKQKIGRKVLPPIFKYFFDVCFYYVDVNVTAIYSVYDINILI